MSQVAHLYKITNKVTGEYYLGKHNGWTQKDYRGLDYWGSGYRIQNQIKKYGKDNFTYQILVIGSVDYIYELEKKYVTTEMVDLDEKCLNLTIGGMGVNYHTKESRQKLRDARAKQVMPADMYEKTSKIMSSLIWMNDGIRSYRIKPDNVQASKEKGLVEGRLTNYINNEYKEKLKMTTSNQWQKVKSTGHTGLLIKVQS
jgi:hypothetical protein